jgi:Cu/Ag efflux pump CusA
VFLVLAAQFESFVDPLIIMFTVPLAMAGALFSLWYFNQTLNIFSEIGMIMLIGLVTKNGILIVEFANRVIDLATGKVGEEWRPPPPPKGPIDDRVADALEMILQRLEKLEGKS